MKSKKGGKSRGRKKKVTHRKKKFSLEFNFGGISDNKKEEATQSTNQAIQKERKKEQKIEKELPKTQELNQAQPIVVQKELKREKKTDPAVILLFLMFLVGVLVIALSFVFKDYFLYYIIFGTLILIINFVFFTIHKRSSIPQAKAQEKAQVKKEEEIKPIKLEEKKLESIAAQKNVQIEPSVDIKKEKAKVINLIITLFVLVIIIYLAISKGFISKIVLPKTFGLNQIVVVIVVLAAALMFFNARRRGKKRKELIKKATQAVISGTISPRQIKLPVGIGGKIIIDGQEVKLKKYQTELDLLLEIINQKKSIGISEIQRMFSVPKDLVEEWGKILEEHGLIKLYYPALGDPLFRTNTFTEVKKRKVKKTNAAKNN